MKTLPLVILILACLAPVVTLQAQTGESKETAVVEGGTFIMGASQSAASHEGPEHRVSLSSFRMAKAEVTLGEFRAFVEATGYITTAESSGGTYTFYVAAGDGFFKRKQFNWKNPNFKQAENHALVAVSWVDAVKYCNWLSQRDGLKAVYQINTNQVTADFSANGWRLPTEAEWEYAARGGKLSQGYRYAGSDSIMEVAWSAFDSGWATHAVMAKKPNELGIFDLTGNADEWCWDWYGSYSEAESNNPTGPATGLFRVQRGGNWYNQVLYTDDPRNTQRYFSEPQNAYNTSGIRLVRNF